MKLNNIHSSTRDSVLQPAPQEAQKSSTIKKLCEEEMGKCFVTRDDFLQNHILSDLQVNGSQNLAGFLIHKANLLENRYDTELWIMFLDSKCLKKMDIENHIKGFTWQGDSLVYFVENGARSIFFKHNIKQNKGESLFSISMKITDFVLASDSLFFSGHGTGHKRKSHILEAVEAPFFKEGQGKRSSTPKSIFSYSLTTRVISKTTGENVDVHNFAYNQTTGMIVFTSSVGDKHVENKADIFLLDTKSELVEKISSGAPFGISDIGFLNDNTVVFLGSELKEYGRNENHEIHTIDIGTKERRILSDGFERSKMGTAVASDSRFNQSNRVQIRNDQLFFLAVEGSSTYLFKTDREGTIERLSHETGTIDSFSAIAEGILFVGLRKQQLQEIYLLRNGNESKLTGINDWLEHNRIVQKPNSLHCVSEGGMRIDGWVIKPADYDMGKHYPGILFIHGGPKMVYGDVYFHLMQLLAARGYFVFFCNPRGSDGKGNEFADIRGNFASFAYADIVRFTNTVLKRYGNLDEARLGVIGGSYGGYMVNYIVGQSSRFKAAVSERSICNLISHFNTSDIGYGYSSCYLGGATPWDNVDEYLRISPLTYAEKVKTPILFFHGLNDFRCHYSESLQMFSAVTYFGTKAKICILEDENHSFETRGKPLNKIKRFDEILEWFDKYLGTTDQACIQV